MIVGEAHIIVRAMTNSVKPDIRKAFNDAGKGIDADGADLGKRFSNGFSKGMGDSNFLSKLSSEAAGARAVFDSLIAGSYALGPAIAQLVGGISALVGALGALIGMAAGAVPALGSLAGIMGGLINAAVTLKFAFSGVAAAIQAGTKAQKAQLTATKKQKTDLTSYRRAVKDAYKARDRLVDDNAQREAAALEKIQAARKSMADAEARNAEAIIEAKQVVLRAQTDLNDAYDVAAEKIQQLNFDAEDAALGEKRAALELDKARETLLRTQDLPPNSRARREAELAYAQADLNYRKSIDSNKDTAKAADKANAAGVEGSTEVVKAKADLAEATREETKLEQEHFQIRIDGMEKVRQAALDMQQVQSDNADRMVDANLRIRRAEADLEKARKANKLKPDSAKAAVDAYAAALADLAPSQRKFVEYMVKTFIPAVKLLREEAGKEFFPKLITAMDKLRKDFFPALGPLLTETGRHLGNTINGIVDKFLSPRIQQQFKSLWTGNDGAITRYGNVIESMLASVMSVLKAMKPMVHRFNVWMEEGAKKIEKFFSPPGDTAYGKRQKEMKDFFKKVGDVAATFGEIIGNIFGSINSVIMGLIEKGSGGWKLLNYFKDITQKFQDFAGSDVGKSKIREYFQQVADNAIKIMDATGPLLKILGKMGTDPAVGEFAKKLTDPKLVASVQSIADKFLVAGPAIADFLKSAMEFVDVSLSSEAIKTFWGVLQKIMDGLVAIFSNPTIQQGFIIFAGLTAGLVAMRIAWKLLKIPLLAISSPIIAAVKHFASLKKAGDATKAAVLAANAAKAKEVPFGFAPAAAPLLQKVPLGGALGALGPALAGIAGMALPILAVVAAVAGLVAIFVAMWNESEIFRESLKKLVDGVMKRAKEIFEGLRVKLDLALKPLGGMTGVVDKLKKAFKWLGDIIGTYVVPFFTATLKNALEIVGAIFGTIIDTIGNVIKAFQDIISSAQAGDWGGVFQGIVDLILAPFKALVSNIVDLAKNIFNNFIEAVKSVLGIASPSTVFLDIAKAIMNGIINGFKALATLLFNTFLAPFKLVFTWFTNTALPFFMALPGKVFALVKTLWDFFWVGLSTVWKKVTDWWTGTVLPFFQKLPGKILELVKTLWDFWWKGLETVWKKVTGWWDITVVPWIKGLAKKALDIGSKIWDFIRTAWDNIWSTLTNIVGGKDSPIGKILGTIKSIIEGAGKTIWDGLKTGFKTVANFIIDRINDLGKVVNAVLDPINTVASKLTGKTIPTIAPLKHIDFALGGTVQPRAGGVLARIGEAGRAERIEPLDKDGLSKRDKAMITLLAGGAGGPTFNIYPSEGMDERELAKMINRELAFTMRKGA